MKPPPIKKLRVTCCSDQPASPYAEMDGARFVQGEDNLAFYKVPDAKYFMQVFCKTCESKMPRLDPDRGIAVIPFGSLDDDHKAKPARHIYVDYKAHWYEITDDLTVFDEVPIS